MSIRELDKVRLASRSTSHISNDNGGYNASDSESDVTDEEELEPEYDVGESVSTARCGLMDARKKGA
jgi:hypothetical protein